MNKPETHRESYEKPTLTRLEKLTDITPEGVVGTFPIYYSG